MKWARAYFRPSLGVIIATTDFSFEKKKLLFEIINSDTCLGGARIRNTSFS